MKKNKINTEEDDSYKVIILGSTGVGKTVFIKKVFLGEFFDKSMMTIGIEKRALNVELKDGKKISLNLLDTSGTEKYYSVTKRYIKESDAAILIYDITDNKSFDNTKKYMEMIKREIQNYDQIPIILLGNKKDQLDEYYYKKKEREITEEEGEQLAKEIKAFKFLEISVKKDGQDFLKESIIIPLAEHLYEVFGERDLKKIEIEEEKKKFEFKKNKKKIKGPTMKRNQPEEEVEKKGNIEEGKAENNLKSLMKYISF